MLNKVGAKPTRSSQVKPQWPGAQQGGRRMPRDPHRLLPQVASEVTVFNQQENY